MQPEAIAAEPVKQTDKPRNTRRAVALRVPFHSAESLLFGLSAGGFRSEHAAGDGVWGSMRLAGRLRAV